MKKIILIPAFLIFAISCKDKGAEYIKIRNSFIESYFSLDFNTFSSKRNEVELTKTHKLLEKLVESSVSDEEYFFDLINYRLHIIENERDQALNKLNSIKEINPMMFRFYRGVVLELMDGNQKGSKEQFVKSLEKCNDKFFKLYLNYLIDGKISSFLKNLGTYDINAQKFYQIIYDSSTGDKDFRNKILIKEVFNNIYLPEK